MNEHSNTIGSGARERSGCGWRPPWWSAFTFVIALATLTALVPYGYSPAAQVTLLVNEPEVFQGRRLARDSAIPSLAFAYWIWAITGAGQDLVAKGFACCWPGSRATSWRRRRGRANAIPTSPTHLPAPARAVQER